VLSQDSADAVADPDTDEHDVIGRDGRGDQHEYERADEARARHRAQLLVAHRLEHGDRTLDGERQDDARGIVGEQVAQVLQQDA